MSKVHKENGGYIGKNYRVAYPSGIYVLGGVGRITDVTVDVELYGGKGNNYFRASVIGTGYGGNGGYTKFRLIAPSTRILQVRPAYLAGGTAYLGGNPGSPGIGGGAGAGVLIADQWLGIAGGGGGGGGLNVYRYSTSSFVNESANNGGAGAGGYGTGTPSVGSTGASCYYYDNPATPEYFGQSQSGGGGGGTPGGNNGGASCYGSVFNPGPYGAGGGGGGNLRIYKDQAVTSGYLSVLPDVFMQYTTHSNGTHASAPQVRITNVSSGQSYTYTSDADVPLVSIADNIFT